MRTIPLLVILIAACGGGAKTSTLPRPAPAIRPADDLADAKIHAPRVDPSSTGLTARDPRVVDLDIIRIRATGGGVGGEPELTSVASATSPFSTWPRI